jgi:membrane protein
VGAITLLITASGVFGEMQSALNAIWKARPKGTTVSRLMRARAAGLGLVAALGFLLLVSLVISAILSGLSSYINAVMPFGALILSNAELRHLLRADLRSVPRDLQSAARCKALLGRRVVGAVVTALLFNVGKFLIGLYLSHSAVASSYGAAGALIIIMLRIYYSAQIFLLVRNSPRSTRAV